MAGTRSSSDSRDGWSKTTSRNCSKRRAATIGALIGLPFLTPRIFRPFLTQAVGLRNCCWVCRIISQTSTCAAISISAKPSWDYTSTINSDRNLSAVPYTGSGFAQLLLGLPDYLSNQYLRGYFYFRQTILGLYFNDKFRSESFGRSLHRQWVCATAAGSAGLSLKPVPARLFLFPPNHPGTILQR